MSEIKVQCIDQAISFLNTPVISSGNVNYDTISFDFCSRWDGYIKTAVFYRNKDEAYYQILENDKCIIPKEVLRNPGVIHIGVFGTLGETTITSQVLSYRLLEGAITEDLIPADPTPDIYAQLIDLYNRILTNQSEFISSQEQTMSAFQTAINNQQTTFINSQTQTMNDYRTEWTQTVENIREEMVNYVAKSGEATQDVKGTTTTPLGIDADKVFESHDEVWFGFKVDGETKGKIGFYDDTPMYSEPPNDAGLTVAYELLHGGNCGKYADTKGSASNALANAKSYTDTKISDLINGAPTTLDTLKEIADAMAENENVVEALESAIGNKVDASTVNNIIDGTTAVAHATNAQNASYASNAGVATHANNASMLDEHAIGYFATTESLETKADVESGSCTLSCIDMTNSSINITIPCTYYKVGKVVYISGCSSEVTTSVTLTGGASQITGLPFKYNMMGLLTVWAHSSSAPSLESQVTSGTNRVMDISGSYITLQSFTLDSTPPTSLAITGYYITN